ncbi:hypothetical protein C0Q70_14427 [Pomacea canaliculata]|uniref:C-type lectin domain-containing protein n=1 Tax=Pomacea canaliculata TaxID=400727 RepID=A0A2T7P005_POMCA|nr:hypothetical protein C0Q70_14427 [Pomacea canaliculata]
MVDQSWSRGEPNDLCNQDCGLMSSSGAWDDLSCDPGNKRTFVCQRQKIDEGEKFDFDLNVAQVDRQVTRCLYRLP